MQVMKVIFLSSSLLHVKKSPVNHRLICCGSVAFLSKYHRCFAGGFYNFLSVRSRFIPFLVLNNVIIFFALFPHSFQQKENAVPGVLSVYIIIVLSCVFNPGSFTVPFPGVLYPAFCPFLLMCAFWVFQTQIPPVFSLLVPVLVFLPV